MAWRRIFVDPRYALQRSEVTLLRDGKYRFRLLWNGRMNSWMLEFYDAGGSLLVGGIRIAADVDLFQRYRAVVGMPPGGLVAMSLEQIGRVAGRHDLGATVRLMYSDQVFD